MSIRTTLVAGVLLASHAVLAPGQAPGTIERCADLVPSGKRYSFSISGTVDATGTGPRLSGDFQVSDPSLPVDTPDMPAEAEPFVTCIATLIK